VLTTRGALGQVTPQCLAEAAARFAPRFAQLPQRRVAVLLGGDNKVFRLDAATMTGLTERLAKLAREGWGLMITPSRRTGPRNEDILRRGLAGLPAEIWDGQGENPYYGILALADLLVVTEDSVNMTTEAVAAGKPVLTVAIEGHKPKFDRFHAQMRAQGYTRPFAGRYETWSQQPFDEPSEVAAEIKRRMPLDW